MPRVLRYLAERSDAALHGANAKLGSKKWHEDQILGFSVVQRGEGVVEVAVTYEENLPFRILDSSPAPGITLGSGDPTDTAYLLASRPIDPVFLDETGQEYVLFNGASIPTTDLSLENNDRTLVVDLSNQSWDTNGTKTLNLTSRLVDLDGDPLDEGYDLSWQVQPTTNIHQGLRTPPASEGRQGILRVARVVVTHGTSVDVMLEGWMRTQGITDLNILQKVHVSGPGSANRVYVLYFAKLAPAVIRSFPNSGALLSYGTVPDRITLGTNVPLANDVATETGVAFLDDLPIAPADIVLSDDGHTLEIDPSSYTVYGHHTLRIPGLSTPDGQLAGVPFVSSFAFSQSIPGGGAGGTNDHGALSGLGDDDHEQYLPVDGSRAMETGAPLLFGGAGASPDTSFRSSGGYLNARWGNDSGFANFKAQDIRANNDFIGSNVSEFRWDSLSRLSSPIDGNLLITDDAGTDVGLVQLGGTTSSYPALQRSGAALYARLADDSMGATFYSRRVIAELDMNVAPQQFFGWRTANSVSSQMDTYLYRSSSGVVQIVQDSYLSGTGEEALQFGDRGLIRTTDDATFLLTDPAETGSNPALLFGGTNNTYPSLRPSVLDGALMVRLADNSGYGTFYCAHLILEGSRAISWSSRTEVRSYVNGDIVFQNAAESDFNQMQFGGLTASYPSLKRVTTTLQNRLADDSTYSRMAGADPIDPQDFVTLNYLGGLPPEEQFLALDGSNQMDQGAAVSFETGVQLSSPTPDALLITSQGGTGDPQIKIGGTTSSYPMIERSGGNLYFRKADESAYTNLVALHYTSVNGFFNWNASTEMSAPADGQLLLTDDAAADFDRLMFGGTTTSYPALRRSGANLDVVNAAESAWVTLTAGVLASVGYVQAGAGQFYEWAGRSKIYSPGDGKILLSNSAATGEFDLLIFGAADTSHPALRRMGNTLQARYGDDSDYVSFTCSSLVLNTGGYLMYGSSRSRFSSPADGDFLMTDAAGATFDRLMWGGTTASFPSIARNGSSLMLRLADDSAYTNMQGGSFSTYNGANNAIELGGANDRLSLRSTAWIGWGPNSSIGSEDTILSRAGVSQLLLDDGGATGDFDMLMFGGVTSAYPAIQRSGANLALRSADDGGYASLSLFTLLGQGSVRAGSAYQFYWPSKSEMTSPADGQILFTDDAGSDFDRLMFGGTTSSYPSLKRSTTELQLRLADDSNYTSILGLNFRSVGGWFYAEGGFFALGEMGSPPTGSANQARLFSQDSAGKTQLAVQFESGSPIILATQGQSLDYFVLGGAAGGQVAYGGTAASEDLTLHSTSHATKGQIFFGTHGAYYENVGRFNFGATTSPGSVVEIGGDRIMSFLGGNSVVKASTAGAGLTIQSNADATSYIGFTTNYVRFNGVDLGATLNIQTIAGSNRPSLILREGANQTTNFLTCEGFSGTDLLEITNAGVIESNIPTGTAPLIVDSTTVVANFNADQVDGYEASELMGPTLGKGELHTSTGEPVGDTALAVGANYRALTAASGQSTGLTWSVVPQLVHRNNALQQIFSSTTETNILSYTVPGSAMGASGTLRCTLRGDYENNSGGGDFFTMRVKFGGTTIFDDATASFTSSATKHPWCMEFTINNVDSDSIQSGGGYMLIGAATAASTGLGDISSDEIEATAPMTFAGGTVDTTSDQTLVVTIQHNTSHANINFRTMMVMIELLGS